MPSLYLALGPLKAWNDPPVPANTFSYDFTSPIVPGITVLTSSVMPLDLTYVETHTPVLHSRYPVNKQGASQRSYSKPTAKFKVGIFAQDGRLDRDAWSDVETELNLLYSVLDTSQVATLRIFKALTAGNVIPTASVACQASFQGFQANIAEGEYSRHVEIMIDFQLESMPQ